MSSVAYLQADCSVEGLLERLRRTEEELVSVKKSFIDCQLEVQRLGNEVIPKLKNDLAEKEGLLVNLPYYAEETKDNGCKMETFFKSKFEEERKLRKKLASDNEKYRTEIRLLQAQNKALLEKNLKVEDSKKTGIKAENKEKINLKEPNIESSTALQGKQSGTGRRPSLLREASSAFKAVKLGRFYDSECEIAITRDCSGCIVLVFKYILSSESIRIIQIKSIEVVEQCSSTVQINISTGESHLFRIVNLNELLQDYEYAKQKAIENYIESNQVVTENKRQNRRKIGEAIKGLF